VHDVDGVGLVGALLDDPGGQQDDMPDPGRTRRRQEGRGLFADGLDVQEEPGRALEQGGRPVGFEPDDLGTRGQSGPLRIAGQRPHRPVRGCETFDEGTADVAGGAGHYDHGFSRAEG
jgi:hypothetical protein